MISKVVIDYMHSFNILSVVNTYLELKEPKVF